MGATNGSAPAVGYLAGILLREPGRFIHAAEPRGIDEYVALCGAGDVLVPAPRYFDPAAPDACPGCRTHPSAPGI